MRISVQVDFRDAAAQLVGAQTRQVPFAISKTLNEVSKEARRQMIDVAAPRDLQIRNKRFLGVAIRQRFATKDNLVAEIYDALGRDYLKTQAEGGYVRPTNGRRAFTVPVDALKAKRTGAGVPKRLRPSQVKNSFRVEQNGTTYIARRIGRGEQIELLYLFAKKARIPHRWKAYEAVEGVVRTRSLPIFIEQLARALATARR